MTGWSVDDVHWAGVRFDDLLAGRRTAPERERAHVRLGGAAYVDTLTLAQAGLADVMLAYEMDGKPLRREHGAPVRVVIPEMYGYKSVKWVERIVVGDPSSRGTGSSAATTSMPGSAARMTPDSRYVRRFSRTERAVHWIHASAFFVLLATGLVLYVPRLSALVARRPLVKDIHL